MVVLTKCPKKITSTNVTVACTNASNVMANTRWVSAPTELMCRQMTPLKTFADCYIVEVFWEKLVCRELFAGRAFKFFQLITRRSEAFLQIDLNSPAQCKIFEEASAICVFCTTMWYCVVGEVHTIKEQARPKAIKKHETPHGLARSAICVSTKGQQNQPFIQVELSLHQDV